MMLTPIWEFWNWTNGEWALVGLALILYSVFAITFAAFRFPERRFRELPLWTQLAAFALVAGILIIVFVLGKPGDVDDALY